MGLVKVIINGVYNCWCIEIDLLLMEDDKEMVEDLVVVVFNDVVCCVEEL